MGIFGFGRKERILDLSVRTPEQKPAVLEKPMQKMQESGIPAKPMGFFDSVKLQQHQQEQMQNRVSQSETNGNSESAEEKKQKFMKKFQETVERLETISTQLYHLQQRIEVLEKKMNIGS